MKNVTQCVDYTMARGLDHRQIKSFMEYLDCGYPDVKRCCVICCTLAQWSCTLKRFWILRQVIKLFMECKHQTVANLSVEIWLNDIAMLTDITLHLSELNMKL